MTEVDYVCDHFLNISNNRYFHVVLISQIVLCAVGIGLQIPLSLVVKRTPNIHNNTKILLAYHQIGVVLHCAAKLALHSNDVYIYLFTSPETRCDYVPTNVRCFAYRLPITFGMQITVFASAAVLVERLVATKRSKVYERYGTALGNSLGVAALILSILMMVIMSYDEDFKSNYRRPYCTTSDDNNKCRVIGVLSVNLGVELMNVLIFPILFCINKNLRKSGVQKSLSTNYQLSENIRSMTVLTPFAITQMIFVSFYIIAVFFYTTLTSSLSPEFYPAYLESVSLIPVYAVILPVVVWFMNRRFKEKTMNRLNEGMKKQDMDDYFKALQSNWQTKNI
ncbi:hypothetical protein QR680_015214 [Steinernema hermaphroditum]|uniref:G-protein coupled receptors family 1 profile domain-containing protein n=1 Tax=Steinernema hermaphroditum TaxID=289476 RepID=A0AA39M5L5_9BILA|nr:hypothetical protein QR680_015214 [Steinernema hermaphroditum]